MIGAHFSSQLVCCLPIAPGTGQVIIEHDRNILIGNALTNCETTINERQGNRLIALSDNAVKAYFTGHAVAVEGLDPEVTYLAELFSMDGKLITQNQAAGTNISLFQGIINECKPGIYLLRLTDGTSIITKKITL